MEWAVMLVSDVLSWAALAGLCTNRREWVKHGPRQLAPEGRQRPSQSKNISRLAA